MQANMKRIQYILAVLIFISGGVFSQDVTLEQKGELEQIYSNLEYNTIAFEDLKNKWFLNDPGFVREIFNRFAVQNAFRIDGREAGLDAVMQRAQEVFDGNIIIDLRKRYYDDEIEYFAFVSSDEIDEIKPIPLFDPIVDGFHLKSIIGNRIYEKLQEQGYFFSNLTKDVFETKTGYAFDVKLHLQEPEVLFWSTTSQNRNKYLMSFFGKWGLSRIFLPGWYFPEYIAGARLTYFDALGDNENNYNYSIAAGLGLTATTPFESEVPKVPLYKSGQSFYFKISGDMFKSFTDDMEGLFLDLEGFVTIDEYSRKDIGLKRNTEFYSIRNAFSVHVVYKNLFNFFDFGNFKVGGGFASHDINKYRLRTTAAKLLDISENTDQFDRFEHLLLFDFGIENKGGLIQHDLTVDFGFNPIGGYGFMGVKMNAMLSSSFGVDVKFYDSFGLEGDYLWRTAPMIVFSPVLRINY